MVPKALHSGPPGRAQNGAEGSNVSGACRGADTDRSTAKTVAMSWWESLQWGTVGEWVSGIGALAAAGVAIWLGARDRARVKVTLETALWPHQDLPLQFGEMKDGAIDPVGQFRHLYGLECSRVVVVNAGPHPVTITEISITSHSRIGLVGPRRRRDIRPIEFGASDDVLRGTGPTGLGVPSPTRIEPYARAEYILDIHAAIAALRQRRSRRPLVLRAGVRVAGLPRRSLSPWGRRLRIPPKAVTLVGYAAKIPAVRVIELEIARAGIHRPSAAGLRALALAIVQPSSELAPIEQVTALIAQVREARTATRHHDPEELSARLGLEFYRSRASLEWPKKEVGQE